eukprot:m.186708 g.186708  ORF g.186708 m.186708 type:complete len:112 (+) comp39354_c0_seq61:1973-2308(+)
MESDSRRGRTYYTAEDDSSSYFHERRNARDTIASKRSGVWAASPPPPSTSDSDERTTITRYDKEAMDRDSEGDERKRKKSHRKESGTPLHFRSSPSKDKSEDLQCMNSEYN